MKLFLCIFLLGLSFVSLGDDSNVNLVSSEAAVKELNHARELFSQGKYQGVVDELGLVQKKMKKKLSKETRGLIYYWKGICFNRLQNFSEAIKEFRKALKINYSPKDINYEYGQALFALDRLDSARIQFKESVKKSFKLAVSWYYIGYISKEKKNFKRAFYEFKEVSKLNDDEKKPVMQATEMQIADMYLDQIEKGDNPLIAVREYAIPQYKKALSVDDNSALAQKINEKIQNLQRKYDLILFQLDNGRPALNPPHFIRLTAELGHDSNVTFSPAEAEIEKSKQNSFYGKMDIIGRYAFYPTKFISISPELRFNQIRYFNRVPEIYKNDNYLIAPALRSTYEHKLWNKPASVLADYDYNEIQRDVEAKQNMVFSSRSHTMMLGERFRYFESGETIFRARHQMFQSYIDAFDFRKSSLVLEQIKGMKSSTLIFIASYDMRRGDTPKTDSDSYALRTDIIFNRVADLFTPSVGLGLTSIDPINDRAARGRELLFNPSIRLAKTFLKKWRSNLKYDYSQYNSRKDDTFAYKKSTISADVEYLF